LTEAPSSPDEASVLRLERVTRRFGSVVAVDDVSLDLRRGEFFSLLGPSGCGKTTLLRMVAGFEELDAGRILLHGLDIGKLPPHKRPVNTVFQHYALFPHLDVFENVAFGLRRQKAADTGLRRQVLEALELVRLTGFEDRLPAQLSGGQKQRVALARALVLRPQVLLLDEPLGALDHKLRLEMQVELKQLQRVCGITFLFVTHDQPEALAMSDRIAVLSEGHVEQSGVGKEIYERPKTEFVARFMGASNLLPAEVLEVHDHQASVAIEHGPTTNAVVPDGLAPQVGERVRFMLRPEWLRLAAQPSQGPHWSSWPVKVNDRNYLGATTRWTVSGLGGNPIEASTGTGPDDEEVSDDVRPGETCHLYWRSGSGVILPAGAA
jgi:spermidine/putrescine transport system ATP-binding protein